MRKLLFPILIALVFCACHNQKTEQNKYIIRGITIGTDGEEVLLLDGEKQLAKTIVKNQSFTFEGVADSVPVWAQIKVDQLNFAQVFLEPGQIVANLGLHRVTGTPLNDSLDAYSLKLFSISQSIGDPSVNQDSLKQAFLNLLKVTVAANEGNVMGQILAKDLAEFETEYLNAN